MNATTSINSYRCMADGWVVNGDPYISDSGSISLNNSRSSFDFNQSLGWLATNETTGQKFSCQHSIHIIWDNLTGGHLTGNVTCTPPQTVFTMNLTF